MASIDSIWPRRDSHNHQPRVKPTSLRVCLKTRTLICPTVNTRWCDWWPWQAECQTCLCRRDALLARNRGKKGSRRKKGGGKQRGGSKSSRVAFRSAREEEEEDRCALLCSTDVETSSASVEGKRKFADRQVGPSAACVQLSLHIELTAFRSTIRMQLASFFSSSF